jgi:hypothetical protein
VMWPTMLTCVPVAFAGEFLVRMRKSPLSHAFLMTGESVFPSRDKTFRADENSDSLTSSLLSATPASSPMGSRTDQIRPSPDDRPLARQFLVQCGAA